MVIYGLRLMSENFTMKFTEDSSWLDLVEYGKSEQERLTTPDWDHCDVLDSSLNLGDITIGEAASIFNENVPEHHSIAIWASLTILDKLPDSLRAKFLSLIDPRTAVRVFWRYRNFISPSEAVYLSNKTVKLYPQITVKLLNNESEFTKAEQDLVET